MTIAGLDSTVFLQEYWQKKPLLIRQAVPGFTDPISPEELAGLACEEAVESRLVFTESGSWRMQQGPFRESDFTGLPDSGWTLMVQSADQWLPELSALFSLTDFLPAWRRDDLMISYATQAAGTGPHFDFYDVFILQGQGTRLWRLGQQCTPATGVNTDSGLKILEEFEQTRQFELRPGDILYIPPGLAHHGTSEGNSLSYSLGFRAPSLADMLIGVSDELADLTTPHERYRDPPEALQAGGEIHAAAITETGRQLCALLQDNPVAVARWFGSVMTAPRYPDEIIPLEECPDAEALRTWIRQECIWKNSFSRLAWAEVPGQDDRLLAFFDGEIQEVAATSQILHCLQLIHSSPADSEIPFASMPNDGAPETDVLELLSVLLMRGSLIADEQSCFTDE